MEETTGFAAFAMFHAMKLHWTGDYDYVKYHGKTNVSKDTFANIYTAGLLGEQYIGLEAGGEETVLKNGDKISHTQDAVVLEKMISQFLYNKASDTKSSDTAKAAE